MDAVERIQQHRAVGQREVEKDRIEAVIAQRIQCIRQQVHVQDAGGAPVAPLAVLFDFDERLGQQALVFKVVFYQQQF